MGSISETFKFTYTINKNLQNCQQKRILNQLGLYNANENNLV